MPPTCLKVVRNLMERAACLCRWRWDKAQQQLPHFVDEKTGQLAPKRMLFLPSR